MLVRRTIKRLKSSKKNHQLEIENLVKNIHYYKAEVNQSEVEILKKTLRVEKNKKLQFPNFTPYIENKHNVDLEQPIVPISVERDKVFQIKKINPKSHFTTALKHLKKGIKRLKKETKIFVKTLTLKGINHKNYTFIELYEMNRITLDIVKFFPYLISKNPFVNFAAIIDIPSEVPTQFLPEHEIGKLIEEKKSLQEKAFEKLLKEDLVYKMALVCGIDVLNFNKTLSDILEDEEGDKNSVQKFKILRFEDRLRNFCEKEGSKIREIEEAMVFANNFRPVYSKFEVFFNIFRLKERSVSMSNYGVFGSLNLKYYSSKQLELIARFLSMNYAPGYKMFNYTMYTFTRFPFNFCSRILELFNKFLPKNLQIPVKRKYKNWKLYQFKWKFDLFPLNLVKRFLLFWQIRLHMKLIKSEDRALASDIDQLDDLPIDVLHYIGLNRGFRIKDPKKTKEFMQNFWLPYSVDFNLETDVLTWISVMRFGYCDLLE